MTNLRILKNKIPQPIRLFLGKALFLFIVWKLLYNVFLYDSKYIDHPLTENVGVLSVKVLNNLGSMSGFSTNREMTTYLYEGGETKNEVSTIYHNNKKVLYIANVCNGLELMVLYIGFIICMPAKLKRKIFFIISGVILLHAVNILRCVGLIYLREYYQIYFQFAHHYLFNATVYTVTLLLWIVFTRKIQLKHAAI